MKTLKKGISKIKRFNLKRKGLKEAGCNVILVTLRFVYYYLRFNKRILAHQNAIIRGIKNIEMDENSFLDIGTVYRGFLVKRDPTLINVRGKLKIKGKVSLSQGVRIDVCDGAVLELNDNVSINSFTKIICNDRIVFGRGTIVGWDCNFLDSDFHKGPFSGDKCYPCPILIGENVWIANHVSIFKRVSVANNCIIQQHSTIDRSFTEPYSVILTKREFTVIRKNNS